MTKTGVLLVACGDPLYGRLAFNCAVSLKCAEPTLEIALAHTPSALASLSDEQRGVFDHLVDASASCDAETEDFIRPKAFLNELTPFDDTLFLDVDTLWSPKKRVSDLIAELSPFDYTAMNYARYEVGSGARPPAPYTWWAPPEDVERHYDLRDGYLYQQSTTLVWFRKRPEIERFYATLQELYMSPRQLLSVVFREMRPDELYYNVAGNRCRLYPHILAYQPVYFFFIHHAWPTAAITQDFWAITTAGKYHSDAFSSLVTELIAECAERSGRALFPFERRYTPEELEQARLELAGKQPA